MANIIRQVFGTSRPEDIFRQLFTFERLATRPIVHLIYWLGLGITALIAFTILGIAVGTALKEGLPMGLLLALPVLVGGWLALAIVFLFWRAFCEFFLAVLSIAEDLHYLRETREGQAKSQDPSSPEPDPFSARGKKRP